MPWIDNYIAQSPVMTNLGLTFCPQVKMANESDLYLCADYFSYSSHVFATQNQQIVAPWNCHLLIIFRPLSFAFLTFSPSRAVC